MGDSLEAFARAVGEARVEDAFIVNGRPVGEELLRAADSLWEAKRVAGEEAAEGRRESRLATTRVAVWQGDICRLRVDAIMNAANAQVGECHYCR